MNEAEKAKLNDAIMGAILKLDGPENSSPFDTEAAFQEFFGRPSVFTDLQAWDTVKHKHLSAYGRVHKDQLIKV